MHGKGSWVMEAPVCQKHGEPLVPITGQGERSETTTGLWQCWSCQLEFCDALDQIDLRRASDEV